ncbi:MAG: pyridoxal phosphate-dependent aminotransferase [Desulfobulbaceae bacterium]|nr:pyridoxal phosphate-dependent aminotransferase [Desulfobulbaceae bacterium]
MSIAKKMRLFAEKSSMIRKMFEEGARMKAEFGEDKVFDFSLGNPDVPPPPQFTKVLQQIAADEKPGIHGYMPNPGFLFVREALAKRLSRDQAAPLTAGDLLMTCGAAGALNVVFKAILDPGDEVLVPAPYFVEYGMYVDNHGGVLKAVATDAQFNLDLAAIETGLTDKTKIVLLNSPNNPTGQIYPAATLKQLGDMLAQAGKKFGRTIYMVSDEPYRNIVFDGHEVAPLLAASTNTIVASSYSKELSLPGERIGYIAVHPNMEDKEAMLGALTLANRILGFVNAPALMQRVVAQLQDVAVDSSIYAKRLEAFCTVLDDAGISYVRPKGAFYLFPKSPIADDVKFCEILKSEKILAVPGSGFGLPGHFRLAFCVDEKVIRSSAQAFKNAAAKAKQ